MTTTADELREEVRQRYAAAARAVTGGSNADGCGGGSCCGESASADFGESLYTAEQRGELPDAAALGSLKRLDPDFDPQPWRTESATIADAAWARSRDLLDDWRVRDVPTLTEEDCRCPYRVSIPLAAG